MQELRDYFGNKDDSSAVAYEMNNESVLSKTAFCRSMANLSPDKYCKYLEKISTQLPVKRYASWSAFVRLDKETTSEEWVPVMYALLTKSQIP